MTPAGTTKSICDEFLDFAVATVKDANSTEGLLRSAISRAYYAIYLLARNQLFGPDGVRLWPQLKKLRTEYSKKNKNKNLSGSHQQILFAVSIKTIVLSQQMNQLYEARLNADYHFSAGKLAAVSQSNWHDYAKESVELAQLLRQDALSLPSF